jgi:hypothetical protein
VFPRRWQPAAEPFRLALVTILQFVEGLSDRAAAEAICGRLEWKYLSSFDEGRTQANGYQSGLDAAFSENQTKLLTACIGFSRLSRRHSR